ncbi:MAG: protein kinase [Pseudomonadota bacterium]
MGDTSASDPSAGLCIGRYHILRTLGRGAMGVVYEARHEITQQVVALKTLNLEQEGQHAQLAEERFLREIKAAISLHHPGIVRVQEFDRALVPGLGRVLYYAMELLDGETLHDMLQRGALAPEATAAVGVQMCEALDFAHRRGVVHRDVKPANIFVDREGRVILTDFGICKLDNVGTLTVAGAVVGTLPFLAPEQAVDRPVDARSDVFAVGAVLYTLLSRSYLRSVKAHLALRQASTPGEDEQRVRSSLHCDPALVEVVARAVAWEPAARYQTAAALGDALRAFAGPLPTAWSEQEIDGNAPTLPGHSDQIQSPDSGQPLPQLATSALFDRSAPLLTPPTSADSQTASVPRPVSGVELDPVPDALDQAFADLDRLARPATPQAAVWPPAAVPASSPVLAHASPGSPGARDLVAPPTGASPLRAEDLFLSAAAPVLEIGKPRPPVRSELSGRQQIPGIGRAQGSSRSQDGEPGLLQQAWLRWAAGAVLLLVLLALGVPWLLRGREVALSVESMPVGAEVLVDGRRVGITPLRYQHPQRRGTLQLEIRAAEREPYLKSIELPLTGDLPHLVVAMPLQRAQLQVTAVPSSARVLVDGKESCVAPCVVEKLAPRVPHLVRAEFEGCAPVTQMLQPEPAEQLGLRFTLQPLTVRSLSLLQILGFKKPLVLDGEDRTRAFDDGALLLTAGSHVLEMGEGEARQAHLLYLGAGAAQRLDLRPRARPPVQPALKKEGDRELEGVSEVRDDDVDGSGTGVSSNKVAASGDRLVDYGIYLLSRGQAREAEPYFTQALVLNPQSPRAHRGIIAVAVGLNNEQLALGQMASFLNLQTTLHDGELLREVFGGVRKAQRCAEALRLAEKPSAPAMP